MIEVEKKFSLQPGDKERLLQGAVFVKEYTLKDEYYDKPDTALMRKDWWLRRRNGKFELKVQRFQKSLGRQIDQYKEIEGEEKIRRFLALPVGNTDGNFIHDLGVAGYEVVCAFTTVRRKYRQGIFTIDFNLTSYPQENFFYEAVEIELMVEGPEQVAEAAKSIEAFINRQGLRNLDTKIDGKLVTFLKHKRPAQYQLLFDAWKAQGWV